MTLVLAVLLLSCRQQDSVSDHDNGGHTHGSQQTGSPEQRTLITNGLIVDGTGGARFEADLALEDGRIAGIFRNGDSDRPDKWQEDSGEDLYIVDAAGKVVAPGFIDAHAHGNPLSTPDFDNFLAMGVTTISLGQDGRSPGSGRLAEWMDEVDSIGTGVNILHFIGHGTVRRQVDAPPETGLDPVILQQMQDVIADAMRDGSFGLSTGLEYSPGYHADMEELTAIADPVAEYGGLVMSHMRSEDDAEVEDAIRELVEQGRRSGAAVHVSHIKIVYGEGEERAEEVLALMHEARDGGVEVTADLYPYTASFTGIGIVFPEWAMPPNDFESVRTHRRDDLEEYLYDRIMKRNGPEATLFGTRPWAGMTLAEVADSLNKQFVDVLIDDIPPGSASAAYFVMCEDVVRRFLQDPLVMISSDGSPTMRHPRGYGSFAKIIRKYVMEEEVVSLEEAIHKMTGLTAATIGLDDPDRVELPRGVIREGFAADLVVFDPAEVRDRAGFEEPHLLAEGMSWVFIGGVPVIAEDERQDVRPAGVIRKVVN